MDTDETDSVALVAEDVGIAVVDDLVDAVASSIPGLNLAWNISKALYGAGLKLRQQKALEWVEMVRDNPTYFTEQVFSDPQFQDAFVYSLERYLTMRSERKRLFFRQLFLGFATARDRETFELEKCISTLDQLYDQDIEVLRDVDLERTDANYQIYGRTDQGIENIFNLIHSGVLLLDISSRWMADDGYPAPFVKISPFGRRFIQYLELGSNQ